MPPDRVGAHTRNVADAVDARETPEPKPKRFGVSRARVESSVRAGRNRIDEARSTSKHVSLVFDAFARDGEIGGSVLAAALGFRTFLFQIPYVCFLVFLAGSIANLFNRAPKEF